MKSVGYSKNFEMKVIRTRHTVRFKIGTSAGHLAEYLKKGIIYLTPSNKSAIF